MKKESSSVKVQVTNASPDAEKEEKEEKKEKKAEGEKKAGKEKEKANS